MGDLKNECQQALKILHDNLDPLRQDKLLFVYHKAMVNVGKHDGPLVHLNDILKVKGVGPSIQKALFNHFRKEGKLEELGIPTDLFSVAPPKVKRKRNEEQDVNACAEPEEPAAVAAKTSKKKRKYVPKNRSGGYAIMLAMLSQFYKFKFGMTKPEIIEFATEHCDTSFLPNPSNNVFYSAWNSMQTLINNELVEELNKQRKPQRYGLSEEGFELAKSLKQVNDITFENEKEFQRQLKKASGNTSMASHDTSYRSIGDMTEHSANLSMLLEQEKIMFPKYVPKMREDLKFNFDPSAPLQGYSDKVVRARYDGVSYEVWDVDSFDIILCVDNREVRAKDQRDYFSNTLRAKHVRNEIRALSVADFLWIAKHKKTGKECVLNYLVERKRLDDLWESIKDNRFMEQKHRLLKTGGKGIFYLVEESTSSDLSVAMEATKTSIWHTILYSGFHIQRTKTADDSVRMLKDIHQIVTNKFQNTQILVIKPSSFENQDHYKVILDKFRAQFENRPGVNIECCHTYDNYQDIMGKTGLLTVKEAYLTCLLSVKGVSLEKALTIQSIYPTLKSLLLAYKSCADFTEGRKMILKATEQYPGSKKVGKVVSETLFDTFGR